MPPALSGITESPAFAFSRYGRLRRFPFSRKIEGRLEQQQEGWLSPV